MAIPSKILAFEGILDTLAEKHGVSTTKVASILKASGITSIDDVLDWKDLDATIQEGLVEPRGGSQVSSSEVTITDPEGKVLPEGESDEFVQRLQKGVLYLPQSRRRRGMF